MTPFASAGSVLRFQVWLELLLGPEGTPYAERRKSAGDNLVSRLISRRSVEESA